MEDRVRVAIEAARLLYFGLAEEYIHAKEVAAFNLNSRSIPSNFEVANELDKLADEIEGKERQERLIQRRRIAFEIAQTLKEYGPKLIGSVWRGTARKGSDIDIIVFSSEHEKLLHIVSKYLIVEKGRVNFKDGIYAYRIKIISEGEEIEIVIRDPSDYSEEKCDIYGDSKRGLSLVELERLLRNDPLRKFIPRRGRQ